ncbi:putative RNA-directed DNA polymerase [Helianthus anomalus]
MDEVWVKDPVEMKERVMKWFKKIFAEPIRRRPTFIDSGLNKLSIDMASSLIVPFSEKEIHDAIWGCNGGKAPRPDGFTFRFYKKFWEKIKPSIISLMADFHTRGKIDLGCNPSFLVLLPKT